MTKVLVVSHFSLLFNNHNCSLDARHVVNKKSDASNCPLFDDSVLSPAAFIVKICYFPYVEFAPASEPTFRKMHIFIMGATGRTGTYGYKFALEQG